MPLDLEQSIEDIFNIIKELDQYGSSQSYLKNFYRYSDFNGNLYLFPNSINKQFDFRKKVTLLMKISKELLINI
ncbi:unnamed protein product [Paramecium octaurelia]|uniref:Uncharacterized protein n=1 Tax=Paramecium octaurelia TaxID=43137 RepID=A0A8S1U901_PAROT|nr:unnamed protein product [Paramecium octaurelia]